MTILVSVLMVLPWYIFSLKLEKLVNFDLRPDKIRIFARFLYNLPPESSPHYASDQHGVISWAYKQFILWLDLVFEADVEPIAKVYFP